ncbi:hypothetical protein [Frigidibacter sp. ROC022]|uniref:hypothetical protein n=1 Tax=Frigidibacter sp. ROC022 TaxID=2971796 RepID=UPI00215B3601|nr:hypothetical protein [Frigidibacter sp. ROC022]MCR8726806.1 hypothetical protein [Frigidibacter sp. ROC022]
MQDRPTNSHAARKAKPQLLPPAADRPQLATAAPGSRWARLGHWLGPVMALGLIVLAVVVLREVTHEITLAAVRKAVRAVPLAHILASLGLAVLAMMTMGLYDVLSCKIAGLRHVPVRLAAVAGFCGYALANALGFHIILGGTVRYRIYIANGLTAQQIAQILALSLGTIWLSVAAVVAVVFMLEPAMIPLFRWAPAATQAVGAGLGLALLALIVWLWPGRSSISILGWRFPVPNGPGAIAQTALGVIDFGLAAGALYVLLPGDLQPAFLPFSLIFITAFLAGALSHSPGGLGVLEAGILLGLGAVNRPDAVAALVVFRLTYYIVPFLVAVAALVVMETFRYDRPWRTFWRPAAITAALGLLVVLLLVLTRKN